MDNPEPRRSLTFPVPEGGRMETGTLPPNVAAQIQVLITGNPSAPFNVTLACRDGMTADMWDDFLFNIHSIIRQYRAKQKHGPQVAIANGQQTRQLVG